MENVLVRLQDASGFTSTLYDVEIVEKPCSNGHTHVLALHNTPGAPWGIRPLPVIISYVCPECMTAQEDGESWKSMSTLTEAFQQTVKWAIENYWKELPHIEIQFQG